MNFNAYLLLLFSIFSNQHNGKPYSNRAYCAFILCESRQKWHYVLMKDEKEERRAERKEEKNNVGKRQKQIRSIDSEMNGIAK